MFKQRLLTTIFLLPLVLFAVYHASSGLIFNLSLLLVLGCGLEWLKLMSTTRLITKIGLLLLLILACYKIDSIYNAWLYVGLVIWLTNIIFIQQYPKRQYLWRNPVIIAAFCLVLLPLFAQSLVNIFILPHGKSLLVYLLCLVWAADIGAYIAGKLWGQHKLISNVSPGKTIEGVIGGLLLAIVVAIIGYIYFHPFYLFIVWLLIASGIVGMSLVGDLFISMLKRHACVKDTGHLLPGHGGLLDRLDSLIAAAPFFYSIFLFSSGQ